MARAGRCPTCGGARLQFAAGCAICGTDLVGLSPAYELLSRL